VRRCAKLGFVALALFFATGCGTDTSGGGSTTSSNDDAGGPRNTDDAGPHVDDAGDAGNTLSDGGGGDSGTSGACKDGETQPCYSGPNGTKGIGLCAAGIKTCAAGAFGSCVGEITPQSEACDGLDNDCDGTPDNGNPGADEACATGFPGECSAGTTACVTGKIVCNQKVFPSAETCDGLDNDCNGEVDNDNPGGGQACSTGLFGVCSEGTTACVGGVIACKQNVLSSVETCDGFDNDCDGVVDNGNPGGGQFCTTGLLGVCAIGTNTCVGGAIACKQNFVAGPETCDGFDNDCDGIADNGNPGGGQACATGLLGVCAAGTTACVGAEIVCNENVASSGETCDGADNDCDGTPDNGVCAPGIALQFDGVDDRVDVPVPTLFNDLGSSDFTIEAWVYPTSAVFARIVYAQGSASNYATLTRGQNGEVFFYVVDNGAAVPVNEVAGNALPLNQWSHVAGTYTTATNTIAVYINGVAQALTNGGASSIGNNGVMTIGSRTNGAQFFQGKIDEVRIWKVARSGCDVAAAFACESPVSEAGLVAEYHFDQGTPDGNNPGETNLIDSTAAHNDGTLSGFSLTGSTSNWVQAGGGINLTGLVCGPSGC
jgi:hypothetical protein